MNEEAVKQLTKQGCMVEKDAAEALSNEDVETIKALDATPMFVSQKMVKKLRERSTTVSNGGNGVKTVQKQKMAVKQGEGTESSEPQQMEELETGEDSTEETAVETDPKPDQSSGEF